MALPTTKRVTGLDLSSMIILYFAIRGVGKSTLATSENPDRTVVASGHEGLGSISCFESKITTLKDLGQLLDDLEEDGGKRFDIVVFDEIEDVYRLLFAATLKKAGYDDITQVPEDKVPSIYGSTSGALDRFFQRLRALPQSVRIISGERTNEPKKARKGIDPVVISCGLSNSARSVVAKHCDCIFRLTMEEGTGRRMMRVTPHNTGMHRIECKSRLPDTAKGTLPLAEFPITDVDGKPMSWERAVLDTFKSAMNGEIA